MPSKHTGGQVPPWQKNNAPTWQQQGPPQPKQIESKTLNNGVVVTKYAPPPGYNSRPSQHAVANQYPAWQQPGHPYPDGQAYPGHQQANVQPSAYHQAPYQQPAYQQSAYQQPVYQQQAYQQQAYHQQAYQQPMYSQMQWQQMQHQQTPYQQPSFQHQGYQQTGYQQPHYPAHASNSYPQQDSYPSQAEVSPHGIPADHPWQVAIAMRHEFQDDEIERTSPGKAPDSMLFSMDPNHPGLDQDEIDLWIDARVLNHLSFDDLTTPYAFGECAFAGQQDKVDPNLDIGVSEYNMARPALRPLPPTAPEAELDAIAPPKPSPTDHESVSKYYINSNRYENILGIRQTNYWDQEHQADRDFHDIFDNPTFISKSQMLEKYKNRHTDTWSSDAVAEMFEPEDEIAPRQGVMKEAHDASLKDDTFKHNPARAKRMNSEPVDEEPMGAGPRKTKRLKAESAEFEPRGLGLGISHAPQHNANGFPTGHARRMSRDSVRAPHQNRPRPMPSIRDQGQEDVLAALGVEGSPIMAYETPGPAMTAPPPQQEASAHSSRHNSFSSNPGSRRDPPSRQQSQGYGSRNSSMSSNEGGMPPQDYSRGPRTQYNRGGSHTSFGRPRSSYSYNGGMDISPPPPPPPPPDHAFQQSGYNTPARHPRQGLSHYEPNRAPRNGFDNRRSSMSSQHTAAGSDFGEADEDRTPRAPANGLGRRKRSHQESDGDDSDDRYGRRQDDDDEETPKQRRNQPPRKQSRWEALPVNDAYRRRW